MHPIRLIRTVRQPNGTGPGNGQYALQKALRGQLPEWLRVGGVLGGGEIPWFWSWQDRDAAALCAAAGQPFVVGPNVLFEQSRRPCRVAAEREICDAASCRLLFTESAWYRELIERHRGPANRAPIVLWPYPIDPWPGGPLPPQHDVLIYAKGSCRPGLVNRLLRSVPRARVVVYGRYRREELFDAARRSRCCAYLSDDDRGPLALAEILLAGCPTLGVRTGAPFVEPGRTGVLIARLDAPACVEAIAECHALDRQAVAAIAAQQFDSARIVGIILAALGEVADVPGKPGRYSNP